MKGTSKVIMGATLAMVMSLAVVLALVLLLLAELYCSLLLRRRQLRITSHNTPAIITATPTTNTYLSQSPQTQNQSPSPPLSSYYAQGVLQAPISFLFPAVSSKEARIRDERSHLHHTQESNRRSPSPSPRPQQIGLINTCTTFASSAPHDKSQDIPIQVSSSNACYQKACGEHLVYISNPIYDNDNDTTSRHNRVDTPYGAPDSSPSSLEIGGGDEETASLPSPSSPHSAPVSTVTPPLTPMKKLPVEACSVSLRDARSLGTSGSDSVSNNGLSSSSSGSPCTSPSW